MRSALALSLAALALASGSTAASIGQHHVELKGREVQALTDADVDKLDLYANYCASAACNVLTPIGQPVTCARNCDRVEEDQALILDTFLGEITHFAAYMAVVHSREQIIWVGRGSANLQNWCANANLTLLPSDLVPGGKVHAGFQTAWSEISDHVFQTLEKALEDFPDYRIVVTGGSLGGAVATLAAANIRAAGYEADLYTYGAPRIGNEILSNLISSQDGKFYRVTHGQDPVPRIIGGDFKDTFPEYWLTGKPADPDRWPVKDIRVCKNKWTSWLCINHPANEWDWTFHDHTNYFGSLECWQTKDSGPTGFYMTNDVRGYLIGLNNHGPALQGVDLLPTCNYNL